MRFIDRRMEKKNILNLILLSPLMGFASLRAACACLLAFLIFGLASYLRFAPVVSLRSALPSNLLIVEISGLLP